MAARFTANDLVGDGGLVRWAFGLVTGRVVGGAEVGAVPTVRHARGQSGLVLRRPCGPHRKSVWRIALQGPLRTVKTTPHRSVPVPSSNGGEGPNLGGVQIMNNPVRAAAVAAAWKRLVELSEAGHVS